MPSYLFPNPKIIMQISAKKLKMIMLVIILVSVCGIGLSFFGHRYIADKPQVIISALQGQPANMIMHNVNQEATKHGIKQWRLDAKSAQLIDARNKLVLDEIAVVFFLEKGRRIYLQASEGVLKTDTNDIQVKGDVHITSDDYRVVTETLHYDHNNRIMRSPTPVQVSGDLFQLSANQMKIQLEKETALFKGMVKVTFSSADIF